MHATHQSPARIMTSDIELISSAVQLPNGVPVPNRLVKAAMEEGIGTGGGLPGKHHQRLYSRWAQGGWGMIITGMIFGQKRRGVQSDTIRKRPSGRTIFGYTARQDDTTNSCVIESLDGAPHFNTLEYAFRFPRPYLPNSNISCRSTIIVNHQFLKNTMVTRTWPLFRETRYRFVPTWMGVRTSHLAYEES